MHQGVKNKMSGHQGACVFWAFYLLFVFSSIDLLHVHPQSCGKDPVHNDRPSPEDGCSACLFKNGANAHQIAVFVAPDSSLDIWWQCQAPVTPTISLDIVGIDRVRAPPPCKPA